MYKYSTHSEEICTVNPEKKKNSFENKWSMKEKSYHIQKEIKVCKLLCILTKKSLNQQGVRVEEHNNLTGLLRMLRQFKAFYLFKKCNSMADSCQCMTKPTEMLWSN